MKLIRSAFLRPGIVVLSALLAAGSLGLTSARADSGLKNPINPNAPTPNSGVTPGHRAAGDFTARRSGYTPKYEDRQHAYTGVTKDTP